MPDTQWRLTEYRGLEGFAAIEADWRRLYREMPLAAMWHSYEAYGSYLAHLCPDPRSTRWLVLSDGDRVRAILPIEERIERSFVERGVGVPIRVWGMPWCEGWSITDAIGPEDDARRALLPAAIEHLRRQRDRPGVLVLGPARGASVLWDGLAGFSPITRYAFPDGGEFVLGTDVSPEEFVARLPRKTRKFLGRAGRMFADLPDARLVRAMTREDLLGQFERFLDVEASGWKRTHGSSIRQHAGYEEFYRDLLGRFATDGHCEIHALYSEDRCIAAAFYVFARDECAVLKSGYDESFARVSPGKLRAHNAFLWCCEDPSVRVVSEISDAPWLRIWHPETNALRRAYVSLRPFSGPLQLAAFRVRYGPVRRARRAYAEWRRKRDDRTDTRHGRDSG